MITGKLQDLVLNSKSYELLSDNNVKLSIKKSIGRSLEQDPELLKKLTDVLNNSSQKLELNPFNVEKLMVDSIDIVKSLIQQRNNIQNLEIMVLTNPLAKEQIMARRNFEDAVLNSEKGFGSSSKVLSKQWKLNRTASEIESDPTSSAEIAKFETATLKAREDYFKETRDNEDLLIDYSDNDESGLNYLTRYFREKEIYYTDFEELYLKLISLQEGLSTVYGFDFTKLPFEFLPKPDSKNLLNKLYLWIKTCALSLSKILERNVEFTLIIPMHAEMWIHLKKFVIMSQAKFNNQRSKDAIISFTLPPDLLKNYKNIRLRGVGIKLRWINDRPAEFKNVIQIAFPEQIDSNGRKYSFPEQTLVATNDKSQLEYYSQTGSDSYYNINPLSQSDWNIKIGGKDLSPANNNLNDLEELYLILDLAVIG